MTAAASPLVSVVVPARNPEPEWLKVAIASAFQESDCSIEVILVDDGSDVPLTARPDLFEGLNVRIHRIPHGGVSRARNAGLDLCAGDFIRFLDADDVFLPGSTSTLLALGHGKGPCLTYGSTLLCDPDLVPGGRDCSTLHGWVHTATALGRFRVTLPAILFPREVLEQVGGFAPDLVVQEDWDFVLRATEIARVSGTRTPVYLYRRHAGSSTARSSARRHATRSTVKIIRSYLSRHPELAGTRAERRIRGLCPVPHHRASWPRVSCLVPAVSAGAAGRPYPGKLDVDVSQRINGLTEAQGMAVSWERRPPPTASTMRRHGEACRDPAARDNGGTDAEVGSPGGSNTNARCSR
jgi:hypothetical protein